MDHSRFPLPVLPPTEQTETFHCIEGKCLTAVKHCNFKYLKDYLTKHPNIDINQKIDGSTLLCKSAELGYSEICEFLLQHPDIDVNKTNHRRESPLLLAVQNQHIDVMKMVLLKGADVDKPSVDRSKEMDDAFTVNYTSSGYGLAPIHEATFANSVEMVELLIHYGCDVNNQQNKGYTPLFLAARNNSIDVAKVLIAGGCNINLTNAFGLTPIYEATLHGNTEIMSVLIESGCDVNLSDVYDMSPLHVAAHFGPSDRQNTSDILLKAGADVGQRAWRRTEQCYAADLAGLRNNYSTLQLLLHHAAVRGVRCHKRNMLHKTLKLGHVKSAEVLIRAHTKHYGVKLPEAYRRVGIRLSEGMIWLLMVSGVYKREKLARKVAATYQAGQTSLVRIKGITNLLTLKNLTRIAIRELMGYSCLCSVDKLPLPTVMKQFLLLKDIVI